MLGFFVAFLVAVLASEPARAEPLALTPSVTREVVVEPGQVASLAVSIRGDTGAEYAESLSAPEGWVPVLPTSSFIIGEHSSTTRLLALTVPRTAAPGSYALGYQIRLRTDAMVFEEIDIPVRVAEVADLLLVAHEHPELVASGEECTALVSASNMGNVPLDVILEGISDAGEVVFEPPEFDLEPGGQREVRVLISADSQIRGSNPVRIRARTRGNGVTGEEIWFPLEVLPRTGVMGSRYHKLPTQVTVSAGVSEKGATGQVDARGGGSLDAQGRYNVDFRVRTPDAHNVLPWARQEEIRIEFDSPFLDAAVGDRTWRVSRLVNPWRYGRGVGFLAHPGPIRVGGHLMKSHFEDPPKTNGAVYAGVTPTRGLDVQFNYQHEWDYEEIEESSVMSIVSEVHPLRDLGVYLEYGFTPSQEGLQHGYLALAQGTIADRLSFQLQRIYAAPGFRGHYRDTEQLHGRLATNLRVGGASIRLHAQGYRNNNNLDRLEALGSASRTLGLRTGLDFTTPGNWFLSLAYVNWTRLDMLDDSTGYRDNAGHLALGRRWNSSYVRLEVIGGEHEEIATGTRDLEADVGLHTGVHFTRGPSVTLYGKWSRQRSPSVSHFGHGTSLGSSIDWQVARYWKVATAFQLHVNERDRQQVDLSSSYQLGRHSLIGIRGRYRRNALGTGLPEGDQNEYAAMVSYTLSTGIPVGPNAEVGIIRGRLFDSEDPQQRGLAGVTVVTNGFVTITDHEGRFALDRLHPGLHVLRVDQLAIGMGRVVDRPTPLGVEVQAGDVMDVELGVVRSASVNGIVAMANGVEEGSVVPNGDGVYLVGAKGVDPHQPLSGVLVELTRGEEREVRFTDSQGRFSFAGIRPGEWKVQVHDQRIPLHHHILDPIRTIEIGPGGEQHLEFGVKATRRRIVMVEAGSTVLRVGEAHVEEPAAPLPFGEDVYAGLGPLGDAGARIDGVVFVDVDGDGTYTEWDMSVPADRITLRDENGELVSQTVARGGLFTFFGFETGKYVLGVDPSGLPDGYEFVQGPDVVLDLVEGEVEALFFPLQAQRSIGGVVWIDVDQDGYGGPTPGRRLKDVPASSIKVYLSDGQETMTDDRGRYEFTDLPPGYFEVEAEFPVSPVEVGLGAGAVREQRIDIVLPHDALAGIMASRAEQAALEEQLLEGIATLTITTQQVFVEPGEVVELTALAGTPGQLPFIVSDMVEWTVENPVIAQVEAGRVVGVESGTTRVRAEVPGGVASQWVRVEVTGTAVVGLVTSPPQMTLKVGDLAFLDAQALFVDGRRVTATSEVSWVSRDPTIAEVDPHGVVNARTPGTTEIYAEWQGVLARATRVVVEP